MLPKVFIGSSVSGIEMARAIGERLDRDAEIRIWDLSFNATVPTLTDLIRTMEESDFGLFVFKPDDPVVFNNELLLAVRDNVIFEAGLFIGGLGTERVMIIKPRNAPNIKVPTDLSGVTIGEYDQNKESILSAVEAFCNAVRRRIKECGTRFNKKSSKYACLEEIHHINLPVHELTRSVEFYTHILKLRQIKRPAVFKSIGAWFGLPGGQQLHLIQMEKATYRPDELVVDDKNPPDIHFAIRVTHEGYILIQSAVERAKIKHVPHPFEGFRQLYLLDPDFHIVEVTALTAEQRIMEYF